MKKTKELVTKEVENQSEDKEKLLLEMLASYFSDDILNSNDHNRNRLFNHEDNSIRVNKLIRYKTINPLAINVAYLKNVISKAKFLQLSKGGEYVRRIAPVILNRHLAKRTIRLENLPKSVNRFWLLERFSRFGKINHITIPKIRFTEETHVGLANVEFKTPASALSALQFFSKKLPSRVDPTSCVTTVSDDSAMEITNIEEPEAVESSNEAWYKSEIKSIEGKPRCCLPIVPDDHVIDWAAVKLVQLVKLDRFANGLWAKSFKVPNDHVINCAAIERVEWEKKQPSLVQDKTTSEQTAKRARFKLIDSKGLALHQLDKIKEEQEERNLMIIHRAINKKKSSSAAHIRFAD